MRNDLYAPIQYIDTSILHKCIQYKEYGPSPALNDYVACYWSLSTDAAISNEPHRILPDGCTDIIFDLNKHQSFLTGIMDSTCHMQLSGKIHFFGIRFLPRAISSLIGDDASLFPTEGLDSRYAVKPLYDMIMNLFDAKTIRDICYIVDTELECFFKGGSVHQPFANMLDFCFHKKGNTTVKEISRYFSRSEKQITRYFKEHVGLPTKNFLTIIRFQNLLNLYKTTRKIYPHCLSLGYYDQSHVTRDLRKFLGNHRCVSLELNIPSFT